MAAVAAQVEAANASEATQASKMVRGLLRLRQLMDMEPEAAELWLRASVLAFLCGVRILCDHLKSDY